MEKPEDAVRNNPDITNNVLEALANSQYDFRTACDIGREYGLRVEDVQYVLDHNEQVRQSPIPSLEGDSLYTLSSHKIKWREKLALVRRLLVLPSLRLYSVTKKHS